VVPLVRRFRLSYGNGWVAKKSAQISIEDDQRGNAKYFSTATAAGGSAGQAVERIIAKDTAQLKLPKGYRSVGDRLSGHEKPLRNLYMPR
jgi:hypothetical protein